MDWREYDIVYEPAYTVVEVLREDLAQTAAKSFSMPVFDVGTELRFSSFYSDEVASLLHGNKTDIWYSAGEEPLLFASKHIATIYSSMMKNLFLNGPDENRQAAYRIIESAYANAYFSGVPYEDLYAHHRYSY